MSGLEKWNRRESALCRLKEFLLRERPATRESLNSSIGSNDSISLDLDQSFQKILQVQMEKRTKNQENKENITKSACDNIFIAKNNQKSDVKNTTNETMYSFNDTTLLKDSSSDSDSDSFEELERMCNKTLSDPDNTIHQYLARRNERKRSSVASNNPANESACLLRLLKDIDEQLEEGKTKLGDQTQLNDIEAPSSMWENSMGGDMSSMFMTPDKPVKFQPRTTAILEETVNGTFEEASSLKVGSNYSEYVTANETLTTKNDTTVTCDDVEHKETDDSERSRTPTNAAFVTATEEIGTALYNLTVNDSAENVELICLDEKDECKEGGTGNQSSCRLSDTFYVTPRRNQQGKSRIIENLIDLDASQDDQIAQKIKYLKQADVMSGDTVILLSDDEDGLDDSESHNTAFSLDLDESTKVVEPEHHEVDNRREFNDTLEEIDYIMKQGMIYLAENRQLPKCLQAEEMLSPSPRSSPQTPVTVIKKHKKQLPWEKQKQPEEFKKPRVFTRIPQCKSLAGSLKKPINFQHIVSPVGAYIKNTPKTPITTDFKPTLNVFQSKAIRGLDYSLGESVAKKNELAARECFSGLPKKAYISSDVKHVVDQRKPFTMPGGEKIHRFLQPSKVPAVIRHEGKIKSNIAAHSRPPVVQNKADNSLADLSTISGDISLHILKDAKR